MFRKLRNFYYKLSIKRKLALTYITVIIIPLSILAATSIFIIDRSNIDKASFNAGQNLKQSVTNIESLFNNAVNISNIVVSNAWIQDFYNSENNDYKDFEQKMLIRSFLDSIIEPKSDIESIIVYGLNHQSIATGNTNDTLINIDKETFSNQFKTMNEYWGMPIYLNARKDTYDNSGNTADCFSILKPVISYYSGTIVAIVEINFNEATISKFLKPLYDQKNSSISVIDQNGIIVSDLNKNNLYLDISDSEAFAFAAASNDKSEIISDDGEKYLVTSVHFEKINLYAVSKIPLSIITSQMRQQLILIVICGLLGAVLAFISSYFFTRSITKPILNLSESMTGAGQGDFSVSVHAVGNDEISQLARKFNTMMSQISALVEQVYKERNSRRKSQLLALQAQINPHFLYNTLESIDSLIALKRYDDASQMTKSLELFYKTSLSGGKDIITLEKEVQNVSNYLRILKFRYGDKFAYHIDFDESLKSCLIVKLSIQPLIENAIYHGIRQQPGHGFVSVLCKDDGDVITISVSDNGPGFKKEIVNDVLKHNQVTSYGLYSVNERIQLYFGREYGINIHNLDKGAKVDICIPKVDQFTETSLGQ